MTTYTFYDFSSGEIARGLTLEQAGRARADASEGTFKIAAVFDCDSDGETRFQCRRAPYGGEDYFDLEADGEGTYRLMHWGAGVEHSRGFLQTTIAAYFVNSRGEAEKKIYEELAFADWSDLRGEVVADADFDQWIDEAREDKDAGLLRCYGLAAEADAIEAEAE